MIFLDPFQTSDRHIVPYGSPSFGMENLNHSFYFPISFHHFPYGSIFCGTTHENIRSRRGTLMLLCASFVPSAVLLGTVPFFQVKVRGCGETRSGWWGKLGIVAENGTLSNYYIIRNYYRN